MSITPIVPNKRLYRRIVERLADMIQGGQLAEGQQLPSERELAAGLQVSRMSLREALVVLEMMGLIETRHGQGRFVRRADESSPLSLDASQTPENESPFTLLRARRCLEPSIAALAAIERTVGDLSNMRSILDTAAAHVDDREQRSRGDHLLHRALADATHNHLMQTCGEYLCDFMGEALWRALDAAAEEIPGRLEEGWAEHRAIYEAIEAQDAEGAFRTVADHLTRVEQAMLQD